MFHRALADATGDERTLEPRLVTIQVSMFAKISDLESREAAVWCVLEVDFPGLLGTDHQISTQSSSTHCCKLFDLQTGLGAFSLDTQKRGN